MRMMSEHFSKCPKDLSQNLTIGLNLKFPAKTLNDNETETIRQLQQLTMTPTIYDDN
jgi:hypothetical protein